MSAEPPLTAAPLTHLRRGRVVFRARRPALLVVPLAALTEAVGLFFWFENVPIWWAVMAAPVVALVFTGVLLRPSLELTREGPVQRQYPFASLTPWEAIDQLDVTRAGNRTILAYRLVPGIPPPRRQPAAALLRAAGRPFDGGWFADSLAARPEDLLRVIDSYRREPALREGLPASGIPPRRPPAASV